MALVLHESAERIPNKPARESELNPGSCVYVTAENAACLVSNSRWIGIQFHENTAEGPLRVRVCSRPQPWKKRRLQRHTSVSLPDSKLLPWTSVNPDCHWDRVHWEAHCSSKLITLDIFNAALTDKLKHCWDYYSSLIDTQAIKIHNCRPFTNSSCRSPQSYPWGPSVCAPLMISLKANCWDLVRS